MIRNLHEVVTDVETCITEESVRNQNDNNIPNVFQPPNLPLLDHKTYQSQSPVSMTILNEICCMITVFPGVLQQSFQTVHVYIHIYLFLCAVANEQVMSSS